jgi:hypothetical protein
MTSWKLMGDNLAADLDSA